jgi:hypothetical protein
MYDIQRLEPSDYGQYKDLWTSVKKVMRTPVERSESDFYTELSNTVKYGELWGAFDRGELLAVAKLFRWKKLPYYNITGWLMKRTVMYRYDFADGKNPLMHVTDRVIANMESQRFYTWYYARAISPGYRRLVNKNSDVLKVSPLGWDKEKQQYRYDRFIEEIVSPGTLPRCDAYSEMIDNRIYKVNVMIVKCSLKSEYRPWGNVLENEEHLFI